MFLLLLSNRKLLRRMVILVTKSASGNVITYKTIKKNLFSDKRSTCSVGTSPVPNVRSHQFVDEVMRWAAQGREVLAKNLKVALAFHGVTLLERPKKVVPPRRPIE